MKPFTRLPDTPVIAGRPFDISLTADFTTDRVLSAVDLSVEFRHTDGARVHAHGFFNGRTPSGAHFILRAALPESGRWNFLTTSNYPALDEIGGAIDVRPDGEQRYPRLGIHPDHPNRLALDEKGPYFALSVESDWLFALDYENDDDIPRTRHYLKQIARHGFNKVIFNVYARACQWLNGKILSDQYDFSTSPGFPFLGSNEDPDYSDLNYGYFDRLDRVFHELQEQGIVAHVMLYVWNKNVAWPAMRTEADDLYFDHVIKRYQAFGNVIWDISKEALVYGRCDADYVRERIARLRRLDRYGRLVTVHDNKYCRAHPETIDILST